MDRVSRFLKFISFLEISSNSLSASHFLQAYSRIFLEKKGILKIGSQYAQQSFNALTANSTGAKNAHNSSNLTNKIGKYTKTIVQDFCARQRYNSADSCSGTDIYQLLKGMVLNVVLKSTHEKQAAKFAQEKLLRKPRPFGLSASRNFKANAQWFVLFASSTFCRKRYAMAGFL